MHPLTSILLSGLWMFVAASAALSQTVQLIHPTNTAWRYLTPTNDPGFGTTWSEEVFPDEGWLTGIGLFGFESGVRTPVYMDDLRFNTPLLPPSYPGSGGLPSGPINAFFRTHFNWSGSPQNVVLLFTNYFDDGIAIFLNGIEIYRFLLNGNPGDPVQFSATANSAQYFTEPVRTVVTIDPSSPPSGLSAHLNNGDNVIAVYVGQVTQTSGDVVFGMSLHGAQCLPMVFWHPPPGGTNITVAECRSVTMSVQPVTVLPVIYQWFHSGVEIPGVNGPSLTITNVRVGVDDGPYTVQVAGPPDACGDGTVTSGPFNVTVLYDDRPPAILSAEVNSMRTKIRLSWSEPLWPPYDGDQLAFSVYDESLSADLKRLDPLILQDGTNLIIGIESNLWVEGRSYFVSDLGGGARDLCKGFASAQSETLVTVRARPTMSVTRTNNAFIVSWNPTAGTLEESSNLITWGASTNQTMGLPRVIDRSRVFFRVRENE